MADFFKIFEVDNLIRIINTTTTTTIGDYDRNEIFVIEDSQLPSKVFSLFHVFDGLLVRTFVEKVTNDMEEVYSYDYNNLLKVFKDLKIVVNKGASPIWDSSPNNTNSANSLSNLEFEVWDKILGNSKEFTYITGDLGNILVSTILYKTGGITIITQTFTYNSSENVLYITAS